jgi:hypothetical protein
MAKKQPSARSSSLVSQHAGAGCRRARINLIGPMVGDQLFSAGDRVSAYEDWTVTQVDQD